MLYIGDYSGQRLLDTEMKNFTENIAADKERVEKVPESNG